MSHVLRCSRERGRRLASAKVPTNFLSQVPQIYRPLCNVDSDESALVPYLIGWLSQNGVTRKITEIVIRCGSTSPQGYPAMASAPKTLASAKKRHVRGQNRSEPETADEYLEGGSIIAAYDAFRRHTTCHALLLTLLKAAVELEEAGEKWRAGDPQKALRFFTKAVELYDAGLRTHSESFDLAYNK